MSKPSKTHALERTSPLGERFIGTCIQCGKTSLTIGQMGEQCDNLRGLTQDQALLEVLSPPTHKAKP